MIRLRHLWPCLLVPALAVAQPMPVDAAGGSRPNPDPTILGLASQERAIAALRELFESKIKAVEDDIARIKAAGDYTDQRLLKRLDDVPALIDAAINHSQTLTAEKFRGVDQQFAGRDVALAAALLAQKTSVGDAQTAAALSATKQEAAFTKQVDGVVTTIAANQRASDDKFEGIKTLLASAAKSNDDRIAELRNSVNDIRAAATAATARGEGQSQVWVYLVAGGSLLIAFAGIVLPRLHLPQPQPQPQPQFSYWPPPNGYPPQPAPQVSVVPVVPVPVVPVPVATK
jgi:hypothetical protein